MSGFRRPAYILPITLEIDTEAGSPRYLNGLVTDFGYIGEDEDEEDYHAYTCTARPFMWYLIVDTFLFKQAV